MQGRHPRHGFLVGKVQPVRFVDEWQTIQVYLKVDTLAVEEAETCMTKEVQTSPSSRRPARKSLIRLSKRNPPYRLSRQTPRSQTGSA